MNYKVTPICDHEPRPMPEYAPNKKTAQDEIDFLRELVKTLRRELAAERAVIEKLMLFVPSSDRAALERYRSKIYAR